jgi:lipid-A-disaccharide synthase
MGAVTPDTQPLRIFLVAGESSGDLHGAHVIEALRELAPDVECEGLGGMRMEAAGMNLRFDLAGMAIMGFIEVVKRLSFIRRLLNDTAAHIAATKPDCLVLIDYPGFNIRLAERAHAANVPVVYYISPQVWAWKRGRIQTLARVVRKMLVILPFEFDLYREAGLDCAYVGHPLLDELESVTLRDTYRDGTVIGLLPGSREQEIRRILPVMIEVAQGILGKYPNARFVAPCVDASREAQIREAAGAFPLETVVGGAYDVLHGARFCLVASGTATVETALFRVPMIVLYKVAPVTYWLARMLVRVDHIGMVNILAGKRIVPEFVQGDARAALVLPRALELIEDSPAREQMLSDLGEVRNALGGPGASRRAAEAILEVARG